MISTIISFFSKVFSFLFYKKSSYTKQDVQQEVLADREAKAKEDLQKIKDKDTTPKDLPQEDIVKYWKE